MDNLVKVKTTRVDMLDKRKRLKASGLCIECKKPMDNDGSKCNACRERYVDNYKYNQDHGRCPYCLSEIPEWMKSCAVCKEKRASNRAKNHIKHREEDNARSRAARQKRKDLGLCATCGKRPPSEGHVSCTECLLRKKRIEKGKRKNYEAQGLCIWCGADRVPNRKLCIDCLQKARERVEFARKRRIERYEISND